METISISAPAKLNLTLDITGLCENGYHKMDMLMQTVSLCDEITIIKAEKGIVRTEADSFFVQSEENITTKSAKAFFGSTKIAAGAVIKLKKNIPFGAGMGGGSADGAGVLFGLNLLYDAGLSTAELMRIGEKVGADIPFCLHGKTARVTGFGEIVTPIKPLVDCFFVVAKPAATVNTGSAFADYDKAVITSRPDNEAVIQAIEKGDIELATKGFCNVFEQVIQNREADDIRSMMRLMGGLTPIMTGSGSAVYATFLDEDMAIKCYFSLCECNVRAYICTPIDGISVIDVIENGEEGE